MVKKDGVSFYARLEGRFVEADGPESSQSDPPPLPQARIVISDINREQQAEARLRQSEARLEAIISTALDAVITVDAWQRIILFNAAAARVFGYQAEQVIGRPLDLLLPERFQDTHAEYLEQFGRAGVSARRMGSMASDLRGRRANGEEFPIEAMISQVEVSGQKFYTVILRDITQRQQAEAAKEHFFQQVSRQREQLLALTRQLAETQEVERKELARELHDRVGQKLTALSLNLNLIRTQLAQTATEASPPQARLDDSLTLVAEMTEHIRDVLTNLRPPMLDDYGLVATLRWYGSQLASRVNFTITVQGEEPRPRLVAPVENALFRITQEALTNVAKHAQASQVIITIRADDKSVCLLIVDDGVGFEPVRQAETVERQGWGVFTMQERAEAVGGQCSIKSRPGQGTQVIVEVTPPANS